VQKITRLQQRCLSRIERWNASTQSFVRVSQGGRCDDECDGDVEAGELQGLPIAIKDNFVVKGDVTTAGSRILSAYESPFDATVVERLRCAGAMFIGKTNLDEFGMGSFTLNTASGIGVAMKPTEHLAHWQSKDAMNTTEMRQQDDVKVTESEDPRRDPESNWYAVGGSSGGSALAVASGMCWAALGSDTGGSVRLPAAYTGVVGLKPAYGLLSRHGLIAYASSLDTPGVLTRTVADAARVLDILTRDGPDIDHDSTNQWLLPSGTEWNSNLVGSLDREARGDLSGLRIGIPKEFEADNLDPSMRRWWQTVGEWLEQKGAQLIPTSIPTAPAALPAYYIIAAAEAASNLSRYDGLRYGPNMNDTSVLVEPDDSIDWYTRVRSALFGDEVQRRILLGNFVLSSESYSAYFKRAQQVRGQLSAEFAQVLSGENGLDLLLTPTASSVAPTLYEAYNSKGVDTFARDIMTVPSSLAGKV
jgi:aspartyl-tRNA(Asn)/glutamyl-tRNA(Gln) amidotransferase subunit A